MKKKVPNPGSNEAIWDRLENLEWTTRSENQRHAIINGLAKIPPSPQPMNSGAKHWWKHTSGRYEYKTSSEMGRIVSASNAPFFKMASGKKQPHRSYHGWSLSVSPPNPGSDEALRYFCSCPVIDNGHGHDDHGGWGFWITGGCPLHCPLPKKKEGKK